MKQRTWKRNFPSGAGLFPYQEEQWDHMLLRHRCSSKICWFVGKQRNDQMLRWDYDQLAMANGKVIDPQMLKQWPHFEVRRGQVYHLLWDHWIKEVRAATHAKNILKGSVMICSFGAMHSTLGVEEDPQVGGDQVLLARHTQGSQGLLHILLWVSMGWPQEDPKSSPSPASYSGGTLWKSRKGPNGTLGEKCGRVSTYLGNPRLCNLVSQVHPPSLYAIITVELWSCLLKWGYLANQGINFTSCLMKKPYGLLKVKTLKTLAYHPKQMD